MTLNHASPWRLVLNVPNAVTIFRLLCVVVIVFLFVNDHTFCGGLCAIVALASDWLDGYLARRLNQATVFGAWLDQAVDKTLIVALAYPLFSQQAQGVTGVWLLSLGTAALAVTIVFQTLLRFCGERLILSTFEKSPVVLGIVALIMYHVFGPGPIAYIVGATAIALWFVVAFCIVSRIQ